MTRFSRFIACALLAIALPVAAQDSKTAGDVVDDTWIHTKVKANLATNQGGSVNIEVYHGYVQLAAFTTNPELKERLPKLAAEITGVKKVLNRIYVVESNRSAGTMLDDGVMSTKVKSAVADGDLSRGIDVNVEVNRGVVLLSGFVDSTEQRDQAIQLAGTVKGVKKVINGMDLKPAD
ncbi:BON domain-containing protein [Marinihelvus fidelis]|nr:BON domain-containing protein [Marinihelvus fidelis]